MKFATIYSTLAFAASIAAAQSDSKEPEAPVYTPPPNVIEINEHYNNDRKLREGGRKLEETCFGRWELWTPDGCNYDALLSLMQQEQSGCDHDSQTELRRIFGTDDDEEVREYVWQMCRNAMEAKADDDFATFADLTKEHDVFAKAYFDGGTFYNEGRQTEGEFGITEDNFYSAPKNRIVSAYYNTARYNTGIAMPETFSNFENCELRAAMCCWTQDRQAGDDNGNCAEPYDENCVDADPADNTDVCYVDYERAQESSRTAAGFAVFEDENEGDVHCHGLAWDTNENDVSAFHRGANLFYVSMYDHLTQRGYVRAVPGAPMCACVEQMPVVTRSDCTELEQVKQWTGFSFQRGVGMSARITYNEVKFNSCQGANNNNNDLRAYYQRLVNEGRAAQSELDELDEILVGEGNCGDAIESFMTSKGWQQA